MPYDQYAFKNGLDQLKPDPAQASMSSKLRFLQCSEKHIGGRDRVQFLSAACLMVHGRMRCLMVLMQACLVHVQVTHPGHVKELASAFIAVLGISKAQNQVSSCRLALAIVPYTSP